MLRACTIIHVTLHCFQFCEYQSQTRHYCVSVKLRLIFMKFLNTDVFVFLFFSFAINIWFGEHNNFIYKKYGTVNFFSVCVY